MLYSNRFLRCRNRLFLIGGVTYDHRVHFAIAVGCEDVGAFGNLARRLRARFPAVRMEGRMYKVGANGELMVYVFGRKQEAGNCEFTRRIGVGGRIFCRAFQRTNLLRVTRCLFIKGIKRNCLVGFVNVRRLVRSIHAGRRNFKCRRVDVIGDIGFQMLLCRIIRRYRTAPFAPWQPFSGTYGVARAIGTIALRRNRRSLVLRPSVTCGHVMCSLAINVGVLREVPYSVFRGLKGKGWDAQARPAQRIIAYSVMRR